jgi:hypothetical protein
MSSEVIDNLFKLAEIIISWPVIILIVVVVFREPIAGLLSELGKRLKKLSVAGSEIEFTEPKTVETPIGKTEVSIATVKPTKALTEELTETYVNNIYDFQISWPSERWEADREIGKKFLEKRGLDHAKIECPIMIIRKKPTGNFLPNVNVIVEPVGNVPLSQYMASSIKSIQDQSIKGLDAKWAILSKEFDEKTQWGLIVYRGTILGKPVHQFARIGMASGFGYVVTASGLPTEDLINQQVRDELVSILNSFSLIKH